MNKHALHTACQDAAEWALSDEPNTRDTMSQHVERVLSLTRTLQFAVEEWLQENPLPASLEDQPR